MNFRTFHRRPLAFCLRLARARRGSAAVEFALLLPVVLLLVVGLYDFGSAAYNSMSLNSAARAAGQYALENPTNTAGIQQAALSAGRLSPTNLTVTSGEVCQCPDGTTVSCTGGCTTGPTRVFIQVQTSQPLRLALSYPGLNNPISLTGKAIFRLR